MRIARTLTLLDNWVGP